MSQFVLCQLTTNPRSGVDLVHPYSGHETLADAKRAAKREFNRGERWVIQKIEVVATGGGDR